MTNTASIATALRRDSIALRHCAEADAAFLRHLYGTTRDDEMRMVSWTDEEKRWFLDMQFTAQRTHYEEHYPDCEFLVIELDRRPVGRLYVDRGEEDIRITDIALLPEFRCRGIGRRLLAYLVERAGASGMGEAYLEVRPSNTGAIRLYQSLGFEQVGIRRGYYQAVGGREDAAVLKLPLRGRRLTST